MSNPLLNPSKENLQNEPIQIFATGSTFAQHSFAALRKAHCRLLSSSLQIPDKLSRPMKIYKTNPFSNLQKGTLSLITLSQHSAKPTADCRLPTADCRLLRSALQIPDKLSRPKKIYKTNPFSYLQKGILSPSTLSQHSAKPTANCRLIRLRSALGTQHFLSSLSTSVLFG